MIFSECRLPFVQIYSCVLQSILEAEFDLVHSAIRIPFKISWFVPTRIQCQSNGNFAREASGPEECLKWEFPLKILCMSTQKYISLKSVEKVIS